MAEKTSSIGPRLRRSFTDFLARQRENAGALLDAVRERRWKAFVFGGTPRGVMQEGPGYRPRDLDIVFDDADFEKFAATFSEHITRRTRFGGLHLRIKNTEVDAWPLSATWAFREGLISDVSFKSLPRTAFFNADAIVVALTPEARGREFYEAGFERAWRDGALDINLKTNPFPALCVVRAFRLASSFRFHFTPKLVEYLAEHFDNLTEKELTQVQESHYGTIYFPSNRLTQLRRLTISHWKNTPLLPFQPFPGQLRLSLKDKESRNPRAAGQI